VVFFPFEACFSGQSRDTDGSQPYHAPIITSVSSHAPSSLLAFTFSHSFSTDGSRSVQSVVLIHTLTLEQLGCWTFATRSVGSGEEEEEEEGGVEVVSFEDHGVLSPISSIRILPFGGEDEDRDGEEADFSGSEEASSMPSRADLILFTIDGKMHSLTCPLAEEVEEVDSDDEDDEEEVEASTSSPTTSSFQEKGRRKRTRLQQQSSEEEEGGEGVLSPSLSSSVLTSALSVRSSQAQEAGEGHKEDAVSSPDMPEYVTSVGPTGSMYVSESLSSLLSAPLPVLPSSVAVIAGSFFSSSHVQLHLPKSSRSSTDGSGSGDSDMAYSQYMLQDTDHVPPRLSSASSFLSSLLDTQQSAPRPSSFSSPSSQTDQAMHLTHLFSQAFDGLFTEKKDDEEDKEEMNAKVKKEKKKEKKEKKRETKKQEEEDDEEDTITSILSTPRRRSKRIASKDFTFGEDEGEEEEEEEESTRSSGDQTKTSTTTPLRRSRRMSTASTLSESEGESVAESGGRGSSRRRSARRKASIASEAEGLAMIEEGEEEEEDGAGKRRTSSRRLRKRDG
jgi:hypothetical protein